MDQRGKFFLISVQIWECTVFIMQKNLEEEFFLFEPSFKNLELLTKNIKINSLQKKISH